MNRNELEKNIARMAELTREQETLKAERDVLDAYFERLAQEELKNSKRKTAAYSANGVTVTATMAKTVSLQYPNFVMRVFRGLTADIVKTERKQTLSAVGKRVLGGVCSGEYVRQTVDEAIAQIAPEPEMIPLLKKKVRGKNYESDIRNLMAVTGCGYDRAAEDAYLIAEAAVWQELRSILLVNNIPEERWQEMIDNIKTGVVVEEQPKIRVEITEAM